MFGRKSKSPIAGKIDTLIAKSARVQGDVEFSGGLHLEGRIRGNVQCPAGAPANEPCTLWISEPGIVEGTVEVPSVVINGSVVGDVIARERVVIGSQARITGNVHYGAIEMALGAQVNGQLVPMTQATAPATSAAPAATASPSAAKAAAIPASPATGFDARKAGT
jgi:cytoskeletal protein CcmA (bactofilin family)